MSSEINQSWINFFFHEINTLIADRFLSLKINVVVNSNGIFVAVSLVSLTLYNGPINL